MKHNDDYNELNKGKTTIIAALCSFAAIILIMALVIVSNYGQISKKKQANTSTEAQPSVSISEIKESNGNEGMTVDDLTFFTHAGRDDSVEDSDTGKKEELPSEATDGKHTLLTYEDGSSEWVSISPYLPKNEYDILNFVNSNGKLKYFENNKCVSHLGAAISESQAYVDFNKLKKAGISFVMLKVGESDSSTGEIIMDEYLKDNLKRATDAGLEIGLYFESCATTEKEAKAEADYVFSSIGDYEIAYPVAFYMRANEGTALRTDNLSRNEKTKVAKAFCNEIKEKGLTPVVYGDKAWLIKYYDPSKLTDFDMCLIQTDTDVPDYPYKFTMWQYTRAGMVDGIARATNLIISFVDYSAD